MSLREHVPWWGKIAAKIVLSRLGIQYATFQKLGLFRHGFMDSTQYVQDVFKTHVERAELTGQLTGKTILEIGPGDGIGTALLAYAHGACAILIDTGRYAGSNIQLYRELAASLASEGLRKPPIEHAKTVDEIVTACNARYLTLGLRGWVEVQDASIDLIFSQAVLEHIRRPEFEPLLRECRRVLKPGGICSHRIDLADHLGGCLNNLRFSRARWESRLFADSGFYTNRLRYRQLLELFANAGFAVTVTNVDRWKALPIRRAQLAPEFRNMPDEELCVSGFDVILLKLA
jgi:SAM-dependent methyltransferase